MNMRSAASDTARKITKPRSAVSDTVKKIIQPSKKYNPTEVQRKFRGINGLRLAMAKSVNN